VQRKRVSECEREGGAEGRGVDGGRESKEDGRAPDIPSHKRFTCPRRGLVAWRVERPSWDATRQRGLEMGPTEPASFAEGQSRRGEGDRVPRE
jgi:hypothetical protein